jgi:hypothetical protein
MVQSAPSPQPLELVLGHRMLSLDQLHLLSLPLGNLQTNHSAGFAGYQACEALGLNLVA